MVKPWEQDWSVDDAGVGAGGGSAKPWEQDWSVEGQVRAPEKKRSFADDIAEFGLDFGKRAAGAVVSGVASIPLGIEKGVKSLVRSSVEASGDSMLPAGIYNPGIDTDEAIQGPETARDKDARLLAAERAASAVPNLPGARTLAKAGREGREAIHATTSEATQRAVADSQISGNIFKGEIDFGSDPSVRGYVMQAADVFGSMLPVIAGSLVTRRPGVGGAIGGGMAAGEGAESAAEFIAGRTDDQLLEESPFFARLVNGGASFEEARRLTADKASESAALLQGAVASVGDRFTGKLVTGKLDPVLARAAGNSVLGRAAAGGALSAAEEGLQEVGEGVASDIGVTSVVPSKEIGEDSAANLVLGALGGGPAGVGRGAYSGVRERISGGGRDVADQTQAGAGGQAAETSGGQDAPATGGDAAAAPGLPDTGRATTPVQAPGVAAAPADEAERALRQPANLTALDRANELDAEVARIEQRMAEVTPENGYGPSFDAERADLAQQVAAARAERDAIAGTWPTAVRGAPASFSTEAGVKLDGDYALMDADDLVTSHDENLRQNPVFPAELQPRDRTRSASELQVSGIVQRLDPARLGMSADAATGAPIIGADGLVESGNARTIALKRVYQANGQKAADYRAWLRESAQQFGIAPEAVDGMRKPVLVRVRSTPVNRAEFARQANQSTIQRMSPSEQASADAKRLTSLDGLEPDEAGDFSGSRDFIRQFMATLPITEQADMIESDGRLSTAGYRRIQNAILARAYGESPTLRRMTESLDNNLANISKALTRAAPAIAAARERIQAGALHDADIAPDLVQAVEGLSAIKDKGWTVAQELGQTDLTGPKYSPEAAELLQFLADNIRSPRRIAEFLQRYHQALEAAGDPNQGSLLGDAQAPTREELIQQARGTTDGNTAIAEPVDQDRGQPDGARSRGEGAGRDEAGADVAVSGRQGRADGQAEWVMFSADSGTLGIPRAEMPQIKAEHRGALVQYLRGRGIEHSAEEDVDPATLKPTQAEFSPAKVAKAKGADGGRSILVSADDHVLDGHHQWRAALEKGEPIKVIRFAAPMAQLLPVARDFPSAEQAEGAEGATEARLSRADDGAAAASNVLQELAATDELFQFPKSEATTLEGVAADINPEIEVKRSAGMPGRTEYMLTMPGGQTATLTVRPANPYGETVYGFDLRDGEMDNITTERPGENPEDVPPDMEDVWIDVSNFKGGDRGAAVYAIAANFAHNTGRIFIGDPAGLSDQAMRRRPEQMLSSALKFGTTRHLAPHPRQVDGDAKLGVPPLKWVYGDDLGNIRRLIDLNLAAMENAGETSITFDPQHGTYRDSEGNPLDRDGISLAWQAGVGRRAGAGSATLARRAVLASLVREEGQAQRGTDGRPAVVLEALLRVGRQFPAETEGVFYSRRGLSDTAGEEDGGRISYDELKALADRLKAGMPNMPRVHVLADPSQAPKPLRAYIIRQDAWYDVEGAMHDGELYLFASGLADAERAEHVLIEHEAAHYGLRAVLGPSLKTAMRLVYMQNGKVRKAVTEMQKRGRLSDVAATEEVIVDIPTAELAKLRGWRRVVAMARDWLAERGYQTLAQKLTDWIDGSLTEQDRADLFVAELVRAARDYVAGKRPGRAGVARGTRLSGSIAEVIERQERWLEREAQARGYRDVEDLAARNYATFEKLAKLWQEKNPEDARLSRSSSRGPTGQQAPADRAEALIQQKAGGAAPVDLLFRAATKATRVDRLAAAIYDRAGDLLDRLVPEKVKAGVVADYGVPEAVIDQRTMLQGRQRVQLRKVGTLIDKLSTLTRAESRVAYEWMNMDGSDPKAYLSMMQGLPEESVKVLQDVQKMIDDLSQEAVRLGQLDKDAFERNRFAYLRRSYAKHITEQTRSEKAKRSRVISILGDQYKGRGLVQAEPMARMQAAAPDWWGRKLAGGKADTALKGQKFIRLEKRAQPGAASRAIAGMDPAGPGRIERVIYWPADRAITSKYADWTRADTWEVRDVKGSDVVLWRDFTKEEREQMGEVDEARFAIAKTLQGMIHDVETGRYLEWLARNYAKAEGQAIPGAVVEASERYRDTFAASEWVKVPDTKIPGTSVKKYGALAGHYLPGPIWNDLRQVVGGEFKPFGDTYAKILNLWKTSKTALSPAVHMNNVMSNFVMADWQDVRAAHVGKALRIILAASGKNGGIADAEAAREVLNRYKDSGGDIGSWVTQEIAKEQIDPLLADLEGELMATAGGAADAQAGVYAALQHALGARFPAALEALRAGKTGKAAAKAGGALIDLYQAEDDVFRLAAWLKAKEEGADDLAAGKKARRSFLDYNINAPWVQAMRKSAWPFVSFTYRAVPLLAEIAGKKPHKLFKLMAFAGGLNALGVLMGGGGDDDERKLLPEEKAGSIWGMVPKLVRMPWNDAHGSPVYLDIRRWIPVGDVFDVGQGNAAVPMLPGLMPGGPLVIAGEIVLNKQSFTGKPITQETDTAAEKTGKLLDYLVKTFSPNLPIPNPVGYGIEAATGVQDAGQTYSWTGIAGSMTGRSDAFGREMSTAQAIASALGLKFGSYPADVLRRNLGAKAMAEASEIDRNISQLKRQFATGRISRDEFDRLAGVQAEKKRALMERLRERLN